MTFQDLLDRALVVLVLAHLYHINLERVFLQTMDELDNNLRMQLR
jgi:hypothetical protein